MTWQSQETDSLILSLPIRQGETSTKYTRDGGFTVTADGYLVTKDGDYVLGQNGRIQLSTTAANTVIDGDGRIYQDNNLVAQLRSQNLKIRII